MSTLRITSALILIVLSMSGILCQSTPVIPKAEKYHPRCIQLSKEPYFDIEQVIGKTWRVFYTWNVRIADKCLDLTITNATLTLVNRFYGDMHEYLQTQPEWDAATFYLSVGPGNHELLLFVDHRGAAGSFLGVPNTTRNSDITPMRNGVPLIKLFFKLFYGGKYLVMVDCTIGVASFMSWKKKPNRAEISEITKSLNFGQGTHACTT